jgi:hypothetical protein
MLNGPDRTTLRLVLLTGAVVILWLVTASLVAPAFVQQAHQGALPAVLNDLLPRRGLNSVEHYLARVHRITVTVTVMLALGGLALVVASRPAVHGYLLTALQSVMRRWPGDGRPMRRGRWLVVNAVIVVAIAGHLFDIVTSTEHWPFSSYGMFSGIAPRHVAARLSLYGVTNDGRVPLDVPGYFTPLDDQRLRRTIKKMGRRRDGGAALERVLRYAGGHYEALRRSGAHQGPPIVGLQLVEATWLQDPWARNHRTPDSVRVLHEIRLGDGRGAGR